MNDQQKQQIIDVSWQIHAEVEQACLAHPAKQGDDDWQEKQRLLLADMAIHLMQTALKPGDLALDKLTNNLHSIMTLSDPMLPHAQLKLATDKLWEK